MNGAIIIMTILGCGQGELTCEHVRTVEATFADRAMCEARSEAELLKSAGADYPTMIALCEPLPVMTAGAPSAITDRQMPAGEPTIVYSQFDFDERPNPLHRTVTAMRKAVTGTKQVIVKGWQVLTGKGRRRDEPILLGRYVAEDAGLSAGAIPTFRP